MEELQQTFFVLSVSYGAYRDSEMTGHFENEIRFFAEFLLKTHHGHANELICLGSSD